MSEHWCTYCRGVNAHNCQFNANIPRQQIYTTNSTAQPAQAGHVPEASCGECGKKTSDGWALYCVACMEKAGLPGGTDSPPLTHSCTSSLVRTPDFTAQAGQVLTDEEIQAAWVEHGLDDCAVEDFARAIEAAVLAKRVPQWRDIETAPKDGTHFLGWRGGRVAESFVTPRDDCEMWTFGSWSGEGERLKPSHWMPLPQPPGIGGEKGGCVMKHNKAMRRAIQQGKEIEQKKPSKPRPCIACNGSGHYDHKGSPKCGACDGTGREQP